MREDENLKYRQLRQLLSRHNIYEVKHRGKGSHRLFVCDNVGGRKISYPVKCHNEGQEVNFYIVRRICETFQISTEQFYSKL